MSERLLLGTEKQALLRTRRRTRALVSLLSTSTYLGGSSFLCSQQLMMSLRFAGGEAETSVEG